MTNDTEPSRSASKGPSNAPSNSPAPLHSALQLDVPNLDSASSAALIAAETPSRQSLFTLYCLLFDKVTNVQKDEAKQTLVYQEVCKWMRQAGLVEVLPQIDTLRSFHVKFRHHLEHLITEISSRVDSQYSSVSIDIGDLFGRNSLFTSYFVRLNVNQHQLLNADPAAVAFHTTRSNDFINCGLIAKGGFGCVYKMQNLTDKCIYAIKAIPFKSRNQVDATKIMKEVYFYAHLPSHQNIVSYKSSWLDHYVKGYGPSAEYFTSRDPLVEPSEFLSSTDTSESPKTTSDPSTAKDSPPISKFDESVIPKLNKRLTKPQLTPSTTQLTKSPSSAELQSQERSSSQSETQSSSSSSSSSSPSSSPSKLSTKSTSSSSSDGLTIEFSLPELDEQPESEPVQQCAGDDSAVTQPVVSKPPLYYCVLCIQMELCSNNLRAWIDQRNEDLHKKIVESIDYEKSIDIFIQIVKGLHHLHSHNLIHRDIKPHNILFSESGIVKIGDFGLSTFNANVEVQDDTLTWSGDPQNRTQGLGTSTYSAPEQQNSGKYDYKADIYSLGLIAFELLYPLFTDMERTTRFDDLKKQKLLPEELTEYKPFADLILETVQDDADSRPDTATILKRESTLRNCWKINPEQPTYDDLKGENESLNDKIIRLEESVKSKDHEIMRLQKELESLRSSGQ